jgi:hypothetical protein
MGTLTKPIIITAIAWSFLRAVVALHASVTIIPGNYWARYGAVWEKPDEPALPMPANTP